MFSQARVFFSGSAALLAGTALGFGLTVWPTLQAAGLLPNLSLTSLTTGSIVSGVVPLWAAADGPGLTSVRFAVSGVQVGPTITADGCWTSWDTRSVPNGIYTVTAVGLDSTGVSVSAPPALVTVLNINLGTVDTTAPTVAIASPGIGASLSGTVTVVANAADNVGVAGVWFTLDGGTVTQELTTVQGVATWSWDTRNAAAGSHVLAVFARDAAGNTATAAVQVSVRSVAAGVPGDLNGDNHPDLLFVHTTGTLYAWFMRNGDLVGERALAPGASNPEWQIVALADFDGDRKSDLLWQHEDTGQTYIWFMDGTKLIGSAFLAAEYTPWRLSAAGDLDGDGWTDVVWRQPQTGEIYAWFLKAGTLVREGRLTPGAAATAWHIVGAADLNRDGKADLVWQNTQTGTLSYWLMNGLKSTTIGWFSPSTTNPQWHLKAVGDFNGDGYADLVWQQIVTGELYVWYLKQFALAADEFLTPARVSPDWQIAGGL